MLAGPVLLAASCRQPAGSELDIGWQGTATTDGAVLTVSTTGGSVWGGNGRLIEQVSIGTETRGEQDLLGDVVGIDASDGRIFVLDLAYSTIRVYDTTGIHLANIGRNGQGPGEFQAPTDLGIDPLRRHIVVREGTGILYRFTLAGEYVETIRSRGLRGWEAGKGLLLRVTRDGATIVPQFTYRRAPGTPVGSVTTYTLYTIDPAGVVADSMPLPDYERGISELQAWAGRDAYRPEPVPFSPREVWSIGWDGSLITGFSDEYLFEIRYPDGRRTVIEREAEPVPVLPAERDWARRRIYAIMRDFDPGWAWDGPGIPDTKPWYAAIIPDRSGRIWVLREGKGRAVEGWTEPRNRRGWEREPAWVPETWFDVFEEATGRYLGRVDAPPGFLPEPEPVIEDDAFIALTEDAEGRPIVRRYRIALPG